MATRFSRRSLIKASSGLLATSSVLLRAFGMREALADTPPPTRFLMLHRPCGTVPDQWSIPTGTTTSFTLSPILAPFESLKQNMVILDGINVTRETSPGNDHGITLVMILSGMQAIKDPNFTAFISPAASIDQVLATKSPLLQGTPLPSLQLGVDMRSDRNEVFTRTLSYSGPSSPLAPENRPDVVYTRLFAQLMPGGDTDKLVQARAKKKSVLDFLQRDLARMSQSGPASQKPKLDAHAEAIRQLEQQLDFHVASAGCAPPAVPPKLTTDVDSQHEQVGKLQLAITKAAFMCDLTRDITFMWAACNSHVQFGQWLPGTIGGEHHAVSHAGTAESKTTLATIDKFYAQKTADFITELKGIPEGTGTMLDNMLIFYMSEVADGSHAIKNMPFVLFGGAGGRLKGGRLLRFGGRNVNDLMVSVSNAFGVPTTTYGDADKNAGPLPDLFS